MTALLVALAGGLGAAARFHLDTAVARRSRLSVPVGTVAVNVTACLLIGLLAGWAASGSDTLSVLGVGFLGGYSTFSTASIEAARLLRAGRGLAAVLHAGGMLVVCLAAGLLGLAVSGG